MLRNLLLLVMFMTFQLSCSNFDNHHDKAQLVCGETIPSYALIRIENAPSFEAIFTKNGQVKTAAKTDKSCIVIDDQDREFRLLVRDALTKNVSLDLDLQNLPAGLSYFTLIPNNESQRHSALARCSSTEMQAADSLQIFLKRSVSDVISYPMAEIKISDQQKNILWQTTQFLGDAIPELALGLEDGLYSMEIRNFDAFEPQRLTSVIPEVCTLAIDKSLPGVELKVEHFNEVKGSPNTFKVSPGDPLEFSAMHESAFETFICLKQRSDETVQVEPCDISDFKNIGSSYNAPEGGAWDLYAYTKDKAGNSAPVKHYALYVYHESLIAEIHALSTTIQLLIKSRNEFDAFKHVQKLISTAKKLQLKTELRDVFWQLLLHFNWAANQNSLVSEIELSSDGYSDSVDHSLFEDAWAVSGLWGDRQSYIFTSGSLTKIGTPYEEFKFFAKGRMVGIRRNPLGEGTILDVFENNKIIDTRTFANFYEDIEIDNGQGTFVLLGYVDIMLVNMGNLDDQRPIPLPEFVRNVAHPGLEFVISPDSLYYFISFAQHLLRIDISDGSVSAFKDPDDCWISKPEVSPSGELYYVNRPAQNTKNCRVIYRITWNELEPKAVIISKENVEYHSLTIVDSNGKPFLISSRQGSLEVKDLSGQQTDRLKSYPADSGVLTRHPMHKNIAYLETAASIRMWNFNDLSNMARTNSRTILLADEKVEPRFYTVTRNPNDLIVFKNSRAEVRTFRPTEMRIIPEITSGKDCVVSQDGRFSSCTSDQDETYWADHTQGKHKRIPIDIPIVAKAILPDGQVIMVTEDNVVMSWKQKEDRARTLGKVDLGGKVAMSVHPFAQVISIHNSWNFGANLYQNDYTEDGPPRAFLLVKNKGEWTLNESPRDGLPLFYKELPSIFFERIVAGTVYIDLYDQNGSIINTINACKLPETNSLDAHLQQLMLIRSLAAPSAHEPYFYFICQGRISKFGLYDGREYPTVQAPAENQAISFARLEWVWLRVEIGQDDKYMNVMNGQIVSKFDEYEWQPFGKKIRWAGASWNPESKILVDQWGETFSIDLTDMFRTPDEFTLGHIRRDGDFTSHSLIHLNPDWMEHRLRESPLYGIQRKPVIR